MTTLYIDRRNLTLNTHGDALTIHENDQHINTLPLKIIERICIHGDISLTAKVLGKLGDENIGVMILSGRQQRPTLLMPNWKLDGKRRQMQYQQSQNAAFCQKLAEKLVLQKITQQIALLNEITPLSNQIDSLKQIATQIPFSMTINILRGLEGAAAAQYFGAWQDALPSSLQFSGRNRRPPRDPINSLLSLGYTLLHFEMVKHIQLCGLDPFIGFYHVAEHGRESLACDLLEPLRPEYDRWVLAQFRQQTFRDHYFSTSAQGCTLQKAARLRFYQEYEKWVKSWRVHIHENCRGLLRELCPTAPELYSGSLKIIENDEEFDNFK
ncbi:CRISPR-associated endonuclease Cas1 [Kingella negevensis]|nr:CRISPR-associated endonuclease Cas1 [Kingella negevensis]MDK4681156.1 CRISPR-associated endonuclease Cas1 [Kingella negevensis]MDK4691511.1 CRISPR-associated endonuclease Cas1 [Kingella negevensis]MDK4693338.1 CRISPR-associated endonuclease Cas1 [Kingella negevensis]MDK4699638.1 CRISPR-associated endonuclease Cas1 [Kingella negevensis]